MATKIPAWAKGYVTRKSLWIFFTAIAIAILVAMFFGGWSIRQTKREVKDLKKEQKELIKISEQQRKIIIEDSIRTDSLYKALEEKTKARTEKIIVIQQQRDERIKEITKPDITNKRIRELFAE